MAFSVKLCQQNVILMNLFFFKLHFMQTIWTKKRMTSSIFTKTNSCSFLYQHTPTTLDNTTVCVQERCSSAWTDVLCPSQVAKNEIKKFDLMEMKNLFPPNFHFFFFLNFQKLLFSASLFFARSCVSIKTDDQNWNGEMMISNANPIDFVKRRRRTENFPLSLSFSIKIYLKVTE